MNCSIFDKRLLVHVLHKSCQKNSVVEAEKNLLTNMNNQLKMEMLQDHLHHKWEKIVRGQKITIEGIDKAVGDALVARYQFKGRCLFCRIIGYKSRK